VAHGLDPKLSYDSMRDFVHISQIHSGPNVLVVNAETPYKGFKELIAYGQANPGKLTYGFTHAASGHMAMELLKQTVSDARPARRTASRCSWSAFLTAAAAPCCRTCWATRSR
jgi:hypothetical protein